VVHIYYANISSLRDISWGYDVIGTGSTFRELGPKIETKSFLRLFFFLSVDLLNFSCFILAYSLIVLLCCLFLKQTMDSFLVYRELVLVLLKKSIIVRHHC